MTHLGANINCRNARLKSATFTFFSPGGAAQPGYAGGSFVQKEICYVFTDPAYRSVTYRRSSSASLCPAPSPGERHGRLGGCPIRRNLNLLSSNAPPQMTGVIPCRLRGACPICGLEGLQKGQQGIDPVGEDAGAQAADGVTEDGTAGEVSALQARHHGHVGGQVAAPAHAHGGEDGNVLCPGQTGGQKAGHQANGRPSSARAVMGTAMPSALVKPNSGFRMKESFWPSQGRDRNALIGCAGVDAAPPRGPW